MPHSTSPPSSPPQDVQMQDQDPTQSQETNSNNENEESRMEDIFDDDDDNDEYTSSDPSQLPPIPTTAKSSRFSDPEIMKAFYQRLLPYRQLFQWLNHSATPTNDFAHREFAFTLPNDVYLRYQSFTTADLFRKQCVALFPSRFEIGPVYSTNPRDRKTLRRAAAFRPLAKELVFDIDMTDYDDIRTCCSKANICNRCWAFMRMAIKVIDVALRDDFGFKHILWVYSGRRGVHAWVCDKRAREMDDSKRKAIATYMELLKGSDGKKVKVRRPLHPHLERSLNILRQHFQHDVLNEQDPWQAADKSSYLLDLIPDRTLATALAKKWASSPDRSSANKWADIDALASAGDVAPSFDPKKLLEAKQDIVLEYTYPRIDAAVSKHLNHLLKSPFCVHPGTGKICVPIDPRDVDEFDPMDVPTVTSLLAEIDTWQGEEGEGERKVQDWEKTRLKPYVDYFRGFVAVLLKDEQGIKRERDDGDDAMQF